MSPRYLLDGVDVTGASPDVHTDNAAGPGSDHAFDLVWIDVVCAWIDVTKHGGDLLQVQGRRGSDEREGRDDHLVGEPSGPYRYLQRHRRIAGGDTVLHAE